MKLIKLKQLTPMLITIILLSAVFHYTQYLGFNETDSLSFRFYYHTAFNQEEIKKGDYVLFTLPHNDLYPKGLKVVKKVSCLAGQNLYTTFVDGKKNYYCENTLISTVTVFQTSTGEHINTFHYSGIIPKEYVFVIGENDRSYDSRYWGFLPESAIERSVHPIRIISEAFAASGYETVKDSGWYKYNDPPKIEEIIEDNKTVTTPTVPNVSNAVLAKPTIPWERVSTMPVKEFSKLFEDVQDYAMTYRTLDNFDTYAKLRAVMFQRSAEFMNVGTLWGQLNPEATDEDWFPTSGFGQAAYQAQTAAIRENYIRDNRENFGLLYFYRIDCGYCQKQAPIISYFEDMSGWKVKSVDVQAFPEAAARFNIKTVPTIILVERETERWLPVSSGIMTYEEIEERLYRTIKYLRGESNEKDFTNPIRPDNLVNK